MSNKSGEKKNRETIFTFNTSDIVVYPVMKSYFKLSDQEVYNSIWSDFEILKKRLSDKEVCYANLKGALIPNQDKDKYEMCFIIDSEQIEKADYGGYVFKKLLPRLDKKSTYSILCGDYIDVSSNGREYQDRLRAALKEVMSCCNASEYRYSGQYFLIYFNRLTETQRAKIIEGLIRFPWFTGYADVTYSSLFKTYISYILCHLCIKCQGQIIASHPSDFLDAENHNLHGYPYTENGFNFVSINEESYGSFLSYKIETEVPDKEDISFSFNALFPRFDSYEKVQLNVIDDKWNKYLTDKEKGKGRILETLGYTQLDREKFTRQIFKNICSNYLYNLTQNEYGDLLFNVCVELPTVNGNIRRTTVALKYLPDTGEMQINTIT